jgi:uncharacterized protein GlcG (DUF336 family)
MPALTLAVADAIATGTLAEGERRGARPLAVVVLDEGGNVVVAKRGDGAGIARIDIAHAKAWGAVGMGLPSRSLATRAAKMPAFFAAVTAVTEGRLVPVPGGVLLRDGEGTLVGAVGVSGDTSDMDEDCALHGIAAAGLAGDAAGDR